LAEEHEIILAGNLDDDRPAEGAFGVARALPRPPVILQRRRQPQRKQQERHGDDEREDVTYHLSVTQGGVGTAVTVQRAYAACEALARSHYENFPVASRLLPAARRPHVAAVYGFARLADDMADEGDLPAEERLARLAAWQRRLHDALENGRGAAENDGDA